MNINRLKWLFWLGFFLILALPLLNLPPWFSPPDWGKTIVFRIVLSALIFLFIYQILTPKGYTLFSTIVENVVQRRNRVFWPFWLLILLFFIFFLATIFSLDRNFSLWGSPYRSGGFLNFAFYIIFAILAFLILRKSDWQKIWDFTIFIGILVSLIAIFQWQGFFKEILIPFQIRPPSTLGGPIFLAIYLLLLSFLTLSFGIKEKKFPKRFFYFLSFLFFIFTAIFITQTRAAFIGFLLGFFYFLFFFPLKRKKISLALKLIAFIFLFFVFLGFLYINTQTLPQFIQENKILASFFQRFTLEAIFSDARVSAWKVSFQALKERPILGYGPENFSIGFDKFYDPSLPGIEKAPDFPSSWWDRAHNFIFDISLTAGIPALIIYLLLFGVLFWQLQKLKRDTNDTNNLIVYHGIQSTFIAYLVANFFSFDLFSSYLISFLLISYSLALINQSTISLMREAIDQRKTAKPPHFSNFLRRWRLPILFLLSLFLIWFIWNFNLKPLEINSKINIGKFLLKNERCNEAISMMEKALPEKSFLDGYLRLEYVDILVKCKKQMPERSLELVKKGVSLMREAIQIQPYHTSNYIALGSLLNFWIENETNPEILKNLKREADLSFEKANQISPRRQEVFIEWIKSDLISGEYQKAKEKAQKCIQLNERLGDCWWLKGLSNIYLQELKEGKENIEIARKKGFPLDSEDSLLKLAKVYVDTKNYQELGKIYQRLIQMNPGDPGYHISLMIVYKELGQFGEAKKEAQKIIELFPELEKEIQKFLKELP